MVHFSQGQGCGSGFHWQQVNPFLVINLSFQPTNDAKSKGEWKYKVLKGEWWCAGDGKAVRMTVKLL